MKHFRKLVIFVLSQENAIFFLSIFVANLFNHVHFTDTFTSFSPYHFFMFLFQLKKRFKLDDKKRRVQLSNEIYCLFVYLSIVQPNLSFLLKSFWMISHSHKLFFFQDGGKQIVINHTVEERKSFSLEGDKRTVNTSGNELF